MILSPIRFLLVWTIFLPISLNALPTLISVDFSNGFEGLAPMDPEHWANQESGVDGIAALIEEGVDRPPVRRPRELLILENQVWENYDFRVKAQSRVPNSVSGRDVIVVFGYVDYSHFYYAHISNHSNGTFHNVIMKVESDVRTNLNVPDQPEARLTDGWHDIRVTHSKDGSIAVYVDDLDTALMTAQDATYPRGTVGFGSFDDTAWFDDFEISGNQLASKAPEIEILPLGGKSFQIDFEVELSHDLERWSLYQEPLNLTNGVVEMDLSKFEESEVYLRLVTELPRVPVF